MPYAFKRRQLLGGLAGLGVGLACPSWLLAAGQPLSDDPAEFRAIAHQAWLYAYPMLMHRQTLEKQLLRPEAPEHVGGFGRFRHYSELFSPQNRDIVTPNNDTPYSWAWLDLRAEPWVLSVPAVPAERYYLHQLVDLYTHNFAYVGVRNSGRTAGDYLVAGPGWRGRPPAGITQVLRSESEIVMLLGRTGLQGHDDLPAVRALQKQYRLRPLHQYAGTPVPAAAPAIAWHPWQRQDDLGPGFIAQLNQLLALCPAHPSERELRARFARIGIAPGQPFDPAALSPAQHSALLAGIRDAQGELQVASAALRDSAGLFGSRETLRNQYLQRALGAAVGIYGNSIEEAYYTGSRLDSHGQPLLGGRSYRLRFAPGQLPPVSEFWSLTLYDLPDRQLVANALDRYSLGSRDPLRRDADGGLTLLVQSGAPAADQQGNWLPAPVAGPLSLVLRLYGPEPRVIRGDWQMPEVERI